MDGDITANIVIVNSVNTNIVGTYTVTYNVSDAAENTAQQLIRTVNVVSDGQPTIGTVYEDAEDGNTDGWSVYDNDPVGATISNVYDGDKQSQVIKLSGDGLNTGCMLGDAWGNYGTWNNTQEKIIKWSMNYSEDFVIYISAQTQNGHRYLYYTASNIDWGLGGEYIHHGLGLESNNGTWQTFTRDLEADLARYEPGNELLAVDAFLVRGSGLVDDIELISAGGTPDTTPPVITFKGSNPMYITQGDTFTDPGATATDDIDGSVTVSVNGNVDTSIVGTYTITYTATNSAGNTATETRIVVVSDGQPAVVHYTCKSPGMVALTFDDGVSDNYDQLLDILDAENVPATFFIIGSYSNNALYEERLIRAYAAEHQIANHTWSHPYLTRLSDTEIEIELADTNSFIIDVLGYGTTYMRPPYGDFDVRVVNKLTAMGYQIIMWDLDAEDWRSDVTSDEMYAYYQNVFSTADPLVDSFISLQHDWNLDSVNIVPDIISLARSKGFTFVTIEECLQ